MKEDMEQRAWKNLKERRKNEKEERRMCEMEGEEERDGDEKPMRRQEAAQLQCSDVYDGSLFYIFICILVRVSGGFTRL